MRTFRLLTVAALVVLAAVSPRAQAPVPPEPKTTPASQETGEPEGTPLQFPPLKMDPAIYQQDNEQLKELARRIESGAATLPERRAFYRLDEYLTPFTRPLPEHWRLDAALAERCLRPESKASLTGPVSPLATYTWANLGPTVYRDGWGGGDLVSGRATALWADPANKSIVLLGTADGGLWKTTDQGLTWTALFDANASISIGSIAVDPNNKQVLYVGTGEGNFSADGISGVGIYKSTDGGTTWSLAYAGTAPAWAYAQPYHNVRRMAVDPRDSNKVYAAVDGGLLYSANAGATWALTTCGAAAGTVYGTDLVLDSVTPAVGQPSLVYAAFGKYNGSASNGVYRSAGGGAGPWTTISGAANGFPTTNVGRITLLQAPSDKKQLYCLIQSSASYGNLGVYYCADGTLATPAWTLKNSTTSYCSTQCWYDMHGTVDPANPAKVFFGGLDDYVSTNSGTLMSAVSNWAGSGTAFSHADHHFLFMPDSTTLYDANDGGFFVGTVSGTSVSWTSRNSGLPTIQLYGLAQHPTDPTKFQGGLQDNGQVYTDGASWGEVAGGDGGWSAWDQSNAAYAYEEYVYASIYRNSNMTGSPTAWSCIRNFGGCAGCGTCIPDNQTSFIAVFCLDPNQPTTMFTASKFVYRNTAVRTGSTWTAISPDLSADVSNGSRSYVTYLHAAKNNGTIGTVYAGAFNATASTVKFWVSTNANGASPTWTDRSAGLPNQRVKSIVTDPANALKVLVTFAGFDANRIYMSTNGGAAWTNISGTLPQIPCYSVVLDPANVNTAYVGMEMGVYQGTNIWTATPTWTSVTSNLPPVAHFQLEFNPTNGKLRSATHGRGFWEMTVTTALPNPKEDSPAKDMRASKGAGTSVNVTYTNGCGAQDNTVYAGSLATLQTGVSWTGRYCNKGTTGSLNFDPGTNSIYFVVVGNNTSAVEGSYGQNSAAAERPAAGAGAPCAYTQNLTGTCP